MWKWGMVIAAAALSLGATAAPAVAADADRGATLPWRTYQAEVARTNGTVVGPDYHGQSAAREASGRRYLQLKNVGDYLEFTAESRGNGVVVRYSLPDDPANAHASLSLSINGRAAPKLAMTSSLSHLYGRYPFTNESAGGSPRAFWDEARLMPGEIHEGDVIRLEKASDDQANEYAIDFVELESVPAPLTKPAEALSVSDFGATPDDATDDHGAFVAAIAAGKAQHKPVWIPQGRFVIGGELQLDDVTLQGAGMWYSTLAGLADYVVGKRIALNGVGSNVHLSDFAVIGRLDYRNDSEPNDGIGGSFGTGSTVQRLWIEHTKTGAWLTNSDGLLVEGCRFRNTIADGINLCVGMHDTIVRDCTARGTGDDCFAIWPATYAPATYSPGGNRYEHCTAQLPFLAQGFSIYGGEGNRVSDCEAIDIPYGCGLFASTTFATESGFQGTTSFERCTVVRAGDREGAIGTVANRLDLFGLRFADINVIDSPNDAIRFMSVHGRALRDATLSQIRIHNAGIAGAGYGVVAADDAIGSATLDRVEIDHAASGKMRNISPTFTIKQVGGTAVAQDTPATSPPTTNQAAEVPH